VTDPANTLADAFFSLCEKCLLISLIIYATEYLPPESQSFSVMRDLLARNGLYELDIAYECLPTGVLAQILYAIVRKTGTRFSNNVIASVGIRLELFPIKDPLR
jgi:hypothetical protein